MKLSITGSTIEYKRLKSNETQDYKFYHRIQKVEVQLALKKMRPDKALRPDGIPIEIWKNLDETGLL